MKIDKSWYVRPSGIKNKLTAGGVVIRQKNNKLYLLLIRGTKFSTYGLPKGSVEKTENLVECAARETGEESGISKLNLITKLGVTERLMFEKTFWSVCHFYLFTTKQISGKQDLQEDEDFVSEWFEINKLPEFFWPEQKEIIIKNMDKIKNSIRNSK